MCAARLDLPPHPAAAGQLPGTDLDMLHAVSNRLLDLLRPGGPSAPLSADRPATPAQYFADLRLTSGLISAAWPASRPLFPRRALASSPPRPSGRASPRANTSWQPGSSKTRQPAVTPPGTVAGNMWHFYLASPAKPHYKALKEILNAYAGDLARLIDHRAAPARPHDRSR